MASGVITQRGKALVALIYRQLLPVLEQQPLNGGFEVTAQKGCLCHCSLPGLGVPQSSSDPPKRQPIISPTGHWMSVSCHRNETYFLRMQLDFSGCRDFRWLFNSFNLLLFLFFFFPSNLFSHKILILPPIPINVL